MSEIQTKTKADLDWESERDFDNLVEAQKVIGDASRYKRALAKGRKKTAEKKKELVAAEKIVKGKKPVLAKKATPVKRKAPVKRKKSSGSNLTYGKITKGHYVVNKGGKKNKKAKK